MVKQLKTTNKKQQTARSLTRGKHETTPLSQDMNIVMFQGKGIFTFATSSRSCDRVMI